MLRNSLRGNVIGWPFLALGLGLVFVVAYSISY
jgi:hypothetical protein